MKHRSPAEIEEILAKAVNLLAQGKTVNELCQEIGLSEATYYRWNRDRLKLLTDIKENGDLQQELQRLRDLSQTLSA